METISKRVAFNDYESYKTKIEATINKITEKLKKTDRALYKKEEKLRQKQAESKKMLETKIKSLQDHLNESIAALEAEFAEAVKKLNAEFEEDDWQNNPVLHAGIERNEKNKYSLGQKRTTLFYTLLLMSHFERGGTKCKIIHEAHHPSFGAGTTKKILQEMHIELIENVFDDQVFDSHGGEDTYFTGEYIRKYSYYLEFAQKLLTFKNLRQKHQFAALIAHVLVEYS